MSEIRCALEFDGVPDISEQEMPLCLVADDLENVCPLQILACTTETTTVTETVTAPGTCHDQLFGYRCLETRDLYHSSAQCATGCQITTTSTTTESPPVCPAGAQFSCHDLSGSPVCSPNQCFDSDTVSTASDLVTQSQSHDAMDSTGECTGELQFFPGVETGCRLGGYQTRWDNCCNNGDKVISDSFSNPIEQGSNLLVTVGGLVDSILGTNSQSIAAETERALEISGVFIATELAVEVKNWLFTPCSEDSLAVAIIASDYCYQVGTKCIEDWTIGGCVQRAEVHCCFNSLMARIVHEQGRPQLPGFNWGSADAPNCKGFTSTEFQALDFSKFDFTEYETEIRHSSAQELQASSDNALQDATNKYGGASN